MFTKPFHITLAISLTVLVVTSCSLLILSDKEIWYTLSLGVISSGIVFFVAQLLIEKYIYNRIRILFNKVLNITYEKRVLKLLEDPFELFNSRIDSYLEKEEEKNQMLSIQQRFRREYIGNIAHELKTPIFTIQGYISTLLDGGLYDEGINIKYLKRADRGVDRILDLLEDLDLITKLDSGEFPLEIETFDILQLTREVFDSQELKAKERSITLSFLGYPKKQIFVDADRKRIFQVLSNLVVNAIKYGKDNGRVTLDFNILSEDHLLIEIIDTGIGIYSEDLVRIFERFYRVDKSGGRKLGGSGLGLSIVKHIVEAHGQTLNVNSVKDKGSTFSFTLKLA
jgi:two-component system phosphate regulon sensor histidine kinase PhoR